MTSIGVSVRYMQPGQPPERYQLGTRDIRQACRVAARHASRMPPGTHVLILDDNNIALWHGAVAASGALSEVVTS